MLFPSCPIYTGSPLTNNSLQNIYVPNVGVAKSVNTIQTDIKCWNHLEEIKMGKWISMNIGIFIVWPLKSLFIFLSLKHTQYGLMIEKNWWCMENE